MIKNRRMQKLDDVKTVHYSISGRSYFNCYKSRLILFDLVKANSKKRLKVTYQQTIEKSFLIIEINNRKIFSFFTKVYIKII